MADGFLIRGVLYGFIPGPVPKNHRLLDNSRLGKMMGQDFRFKLNLFGKSLLHGFGYQRVKLLAPTTQQAFIGGILN